MSFSTVLMGAESLLVQCGQILIDRGHTVREVVTDNPDIAQWARDQGARVVPPGKGLHERLEGPFDWFFSIANLRIVPDAVLAMAKLGAVNFHDGPLPTYAGLNAPNWALMNRETQHGVSWHRIEGGVDEGRILAQRFFEVAPLQSALELNTTCFENAIESFPEVLDRLERGDDGGEAQDLGRRTYFGKDDRPEALALLDWNQEAEALVAIVRALDFGTKYTNPLHIAKLLRGGVAYLATDAELVHQSGRPGEVVDADATSITVAAKSGAVRLLGLKTQDGTPVDLSAAPWKGTTLDSPDADTRARLTELNARFCPADAFFGKRLRRLSVPALPLGLSNAAESDRSAHVPLDVRSTGSAFVAGVAAWASRLSGAQVLDMWVQDAAVAAEIGDAPAFFSSVAPMRLKAEGTITELLAQVDAEAKRLGERGTFALDRVARDPSVAPYAVEWAVAPRASDRLAGTAVTFSEQAVHYDPSRLSEAQARSIASRLSVVMRAARLAPETAVAKLSLLADDERTKMLVEWNATSADYDEDACIHSLFEAQVDRTPDATALTFEGHSLTYAQVDARANQVAHELAHAGVGADQIVGLYCHRSLELVIGALGILKAGGAYLPLDPEYPAERVSLMLEDSKAQVVVTHGEARAGLRSSAKIVDLDRLESGDGTGDARLLGRASASNLAYVIYTSGSTGRPKGVMVEHRQASNFFTGMDARIPAKDRKVWLAVTSLSFDISVLELFWTLSRGFEVVVYRDRVKTSATSSRPMDFGIFYWGNDDGQGPKKYELLLEGAKLADRSGFTSLWTPERHFHAFGGPYPNPAVTGAAVAAVTKNLDIRAGSCVAPLHHPIRIAEEWAVIDNLTNGRAGLAFAAGWQPDDFVLRPENTPPKNKPAMLESVDIVRRLWRGEEVEFAKEDGSMFKVVTQPRPVSPELNVWVTTAGNPQTYKDAAAKGAHVLTHLLGQSIEEVGEKIVIYRNALRENGYDPADFKVTLMLHTYLDETREKAREAAREPMKGYLRAAAGLIKQYAWAFPTFQKPEGVTNPYEIDLGALSDDEMDGILEFAFTRYFEDSGFFGTVEDAVARVESLKAIGVDEIACLVDYGFETPQVLRSLERVAEVVKRTSRPVVVDDAPSVDTRLGPTLARHQVSHMQCTPSMARMLTLDESATSELKHLDCFMIGGEALPGALVAELGKYTKAHVENMYGPTETTIWSSTFGASSGGQAQVGTDAITPIGTPIANTQLYVLDAGLQPMPVGAAGELYIGGAGVTRGYLHRPDLTAQRFVTDPFADGEARMYRTGDLVRWREDGVLEFIGRVDHQVKLRGYRIELGEIEARLQDLPQVQDAVVMAREDQPGDMRLVAYITSNESADGLEETLKSTLGSALPDYMVPSHIVTMDSLPLTPNKKVDRKQLPPPGEVSQAARAEYIAPENDVEEKIAGVWCKVLGLERVGSRDNFFDLGGHSLLAVQAHREIKAALQSTRLSITDIFRFPTLGGLAGYLGDDSKSSEKLDKTAARAAARRDAMKRRRGR